MANNRALSWSAALRDLKDDRSRRRDVREERLRMAAGLRAGAPSLSAWRGRSGRRYVVGVHALADDLDEVDEAVVIAVRRNEAGIAELVSVASSGESPRAHLRRTWQRTWLAQARRGGATEIHVHRLAEGPAGRAAVVEDLRADEREPARG